MGFSTDQNSLDEKKSKFEELVDLQNRIREYQLAGYGLVEDPKSVQE